MLRPVVLSNDNVVEVLRKEAQRHMTLAQAYDRAADALEGKRSAPATVQPTQPKPRPLPTATGGGYY